MAAYSLDFRTRVLKDSDAGMVSKLVAEKYAVSRAWVDRLKQRRRETGEIAPRRQTRWRTPALLHESSRARTMPTDRILTCRFDTTLVGRGRSSD